MPGFDHRFIKRFFRKAGVCFLFSALVLSFAACGGGGDGDENALASLKEQIGDAVNGGPHATVEADESAPDWDNSPKVLVNEATGKKTFAENDATVDYSNISQGYVMVKYDGDNDNVKVQVTNKGSEEGTYTYDLATDGEFQALPLTQGDGKYDVSVFTNIEGDKYALAAQKTVKMKLKDEFSPYLRPSQYVDYVADSNCVAKASELTQGTKSDLGAAEQIYLYVVENVTYDYEKVKTVEPGYLPNLDETLSTGKGICFDFAALTVAMLRSQGIPCKLIIGYAGSAYHSWIAVYSKETGEFAAIIEFKGDKYNLADPTFTAAGDEADPNVVGDGTEYQPIYYY
ncbi:MAG: transglutaminase-like domain-containing protein [Clostridiales Family XIII bacterium]|nr:transglutaminase-like domain-containing protein [Clostridiales Family XIII bacterium]